MVVDKKVSLSLVGTDGNAFSLMAAFAQQAKREGWLDEEVEKVLTEAKSKDYDHLLSTLSSHCKYPGDN